MTSTPPPRRPDASMDLLNGILRQPLDPDYTAETASKPSAKNRWATAVVFLVAGALLSGGAAQTVHGAPAVAAERSELISLIEEKNQSVDNARQTLADLETTNREKRSARLGDDAAAEALFNEIEVLEVASGATAVTGDGIMITLSDAAQPGSSGYIVDLDLRQTANGLWQAGAEAIAINGHRLSSRTAIRGAGSAITVDYRSLTAPYKIQAIGDPSTLRSGFERSAGGAWVSYLRDTHDIGYIISTERDMRLDADPGLGVTRAKQTKR